MVEATNGFFIGRYEVTQEQWKALMGTSPSSFAGPKRPVEHVSWYDCHLFVDRVNELDGVRSRSLRFRLPTVEEWELCCRAGGTTNDFGLLASGEPGAIGDIGWYRGNSEMSTHEVGTRQPNAWGIYDMHGNVWENCDTFVFGGCVAKGGCWISPASSCRADYKLPMLTFVDNDDRGFRLAADFVGEEPVAEAAEDLP
jgi:formylglycine-generating enzyme required for sulfatase activity